MDSRRWLLFLANVLILHVTIAQYEYIQHLCETNSSYTRNSIYQTNLENVLASLSSTTNIISGFYTLSVGENANKVNLLALCRGDLEPNSCSTCLVNSARDLRQLCSNEKEAIVWYDSCMLRYSNRTISHSLQTEPAIKLNDSSGATNVVQFNRVMRNLLENLRGEAARGSSAMKFATGNMSVGSDNVMIFALVQCTPDLLEWQCNDCLNTIFGELPTCCDGKIGGRVDTPSCQFRYEIERFYDDTLHREVPPPSGAEGRKTVITISASVSASLVVAVLLGFCICYRRRRKRLEKEKQENYQKIQLLDVAGDRIAEEYLGESFPGEINQAKFQDLPLLPLELIRTATQQFSQENKLGEGGFGPVYKGALVDGKEIAVKRLSRNSGQGLQEFKAEVILIARLQHRNLVKLLGCCLEGKELLLVYDYMPNKSLDFFLFDSMRGAQIDWKMRHRIINGIARGMLYLHEDSRLRIIHRDLKSSNVLLDHEMNPKISDFGMARIFGSNQSEANTNRVVGTYGYMAPEYAMKGIFSVKSDVFSFGVLLLEIISGKKNSRFHLSGDGHNLLTFAWKLWSDGQGLELIDLLLKESYVESEVLKCIHIGLLCIQEDPANRPTMSSVVFMMGSDAMTLPQPTEPAFFLGRVVPSAQPEPKDIGSSVNEVTLSNVSPR